MKFTIKIDTTQATSLLNDGFAKQIPFLTAKTLTVLARDTQEHIKTRLPSVFDKPTLFTQRGVFMERAEKSALKATVYVPESQPQSGKSQREYIRPGALGGSRSQKRTEMLLTRAGFLPAGWVSVPGSYFKGGAHLDGYGNIPGGIYKQIVNLLQIKKFDTKGARGVYTASQKRIAKMGVADEFFGVGRGSNNLAKGGGWLPPGVYRRTGKGGAKLIQYLLFVPKAKYSVRLDVLKEAQTSVTTNLNKRWLESYQTILDKFKAR